MGPPRLRPQLTMEPRVENPNIKPIGTEICPALSSRLFHTPNMKGYKNQGEPIKVVYPIKEHCLLIKETQNMSKDQAAQKDANTLREKLALGNENPSIGSEPIGGRISELRGFNEGRVYFRKIRKSEETVTKYSVNQTKTKNVLIIKHLYLKFYHF